MSDLPEMPVPPVPPMSPVYPPVFVPAAVGPVMPAEKPWYFSDWCWPLLMVFLSSFGWGAAIALLVANPYLTSGGKWARIGIAVGIVIVLIILTAFFLEVARPY